MQQFFFCKISFRLEIRKHRQVKKCFYIINIPFANFEYSGYSCNLNISFIILTIVHNTNSVCFLDPLMLSKHPSLFKGEKRALGTNRSKRIYNSEWFQT